MLLEELANILLAVPEETCSKYHVGNFRLQQRCLDRQGLVLGGSGSDGSWAFVADCGACSGVLELGLGADQPRRW